MGTWRFVVLCSAVWLACAEYRQGMPDKGDTESYQCDLCHGGEVFRDTKGHDSPMYRGVGAHDAHLNQAAISAPIPCDTCHAVPSNVQARGHMDTPLPAEVIFSGLALARASDPILIRPDSPYDEFAMIECANVYCHGAKLSGGKKTKPRWNGPAEELTAFSACDACHGFPPPLPHPASKQCSDCHGAVMAQDGSFADKSRHVNGVVDVAPKTRCYDCHGTPESPAPPPDLQGRSDPTLKTVGAHQAHLAALHSIASPVACEECHKVPSKVSDPGHIDESPGAEVIMVGLAALGGLKPAYDPESGTCSSVYCHGATLTSGSVKTPVWNDTSGAARQCGACHGLPPPPPHPPSTSCGACHQATAQGTTIKDTRFHINGKLEVSPPSCNSCHGNEENSAPPVDTHGRSDTSLVSVGAHQSHLKAVLSAPIACEACHLVPSGLDDPAHLDGDEVAEVVFGALAKAKGLNPVWHRTDARCALVYCHGASLKGGSLTTPKWTLVDGSQKACGACHAIPPPTGKHPGVFGPHNFIGKNCTYCHQGVTNTTGDQVTNPNLHINGNLNVIISQGTWADATKTCDPACHGPKKW